MRFRPLFPTCLFTASVLCAQIQIRWDASPSGRSVSCPANPSGSSLTVRVTNINNVIYAHAIETVATATPVYPPAPITLLSGGNPVLNTARLAVDRLLNLYKPGFVPALKASGVYENFPLSRTMGAWAAVTSSSDWSALAATKAAVLAVVPATAIETDLRNGVLLDIAKLEAALAAVAAAAGNSASTTVNIDWAAKNVVRVRVTQTFAGAPVENGEQTFECTIDTGAFTLSLGPIFSKVQNRRYVSQAVPSGTATSNVLGVEYGSGLRPAGTTLVNFSLPRLTRDNWAISLSTGPVVKSSADNTSSFGWFIGPSISLSRLLYLTPGFHFGEFSEFPMGYFEGSPIPSGVASPTSLKRWSWRFAFGITFRAANFSKTQAQTPAPAQQPAQAPADPGSTRPATGAGAAPPAGGAGIPANPGTNPAPPTPPQE